MAFVQEIAAAVAGSKVNRVELTAQEEARTVQAAGRVVEATEAMLAALSADHKAEGSLVAVPEAMMAGEVKAAE